MRQDIFSENHSDDNGNPAGGIAEGIGIDIVWQNGPLGRGEDRVTQNGAFVEGVIQAAIDRIEYYQTTKFNCESNTNALACLYEAISHLDSRTKDRELRGVEGLYKV